MRRGNSPAVLLVECPTRVLAGRRYEAGGPRRVTAKVEVHITRHALLVAIANAPSVCAGTVLDMVKRSDRTIPTRLLFEF